MREGVRKRERERVSRKIETELERKERGIYLKQ